jgi:hypothetical protein
VGNAAGVVLGDLPNGSDLLNAHVASEPVPQRRLEELNEGVHNLAAGDFDRLAATEDAASSRL